MSLEYVIDIGPLAIEVTSKPTYGALLPVKFFFNQFPDMWG